MLEVAAFVIPVLVVIFTAALLNTWMKHRAEARQERVRLLEEALKNPSLDRATIESLAFQLTGARSPRQQPGRSRLMAVILGVGWFSLFVGVVLAILGKTTHESDMVAGGVITAVAGFALMTYPFALRELESRRAES
ncbi:MAG: hypothetical protein H6835_14200 [Planctomycetes bacterium]|nr:hypothetical protein [Planctomycetota bacterium]